MSEADVAHWLTSFVNITFGDESKHDGASGRVGFGSILLKKSFAERMPIFQRPPMRLTPSDTGDHVNLRKIALRSSQSYGKGLYCQSLPRPDLSEIFAVALLSTFSTVSAKSRCSFR
jgi:hypothetical protein